MVKRWRLRFRQNLSGSSPFPLGEFFVSAVFLFVLCQYAYRRSTKDRDWMWEVDVYATENIFVFGIRVSQKSVTASNINYFSVRMIV